MWTKETIKILSKKTSLIWYLEHYVSSRKTSNTNVPLEKCRTIVVLQASCGFAVPRSKGEVNRGKKIKPNVYYHKRSSDKRPLSIIQMVIYQIPRNRSPQTSDHRLNFTIDLLSPIANGHLQSSSEAQGHLVVAKRSKPGRNLSDGSFQEKWQERGYNTKLLHDDGLLMFLCARNLIFR